MACMEHECVECGYAWADNATRVHCPKCGGRATNTFDEQIDRDEFWDDIGRPDDYDDDDDDRSWAV